MEHKDVLNAVRALQAAPPRTGRGNLTSLVDSMPLSHTARMAVKGAAAAETDSRVASIVWWAD
jgi:hypothetical protein